MSEIDKKAIGSHAACFVREYCKKFGPKQKEWKNVFGFEKQQLTAWINGDYLPTTDQLLRFSRHAGVHIEDILGWTPPSKFGPLAK